MEWGLVAIWLAAFLGLFAAGLPVAAALCPRLADRGAGVAIPAALTVLGLVGWIAGRVVFGLPAALAGLLVAVVLAGLALRTEVALPDRSVVAETALVFSLAFLFVVGIRAVDPSVHATMGEKFLDFGLLKSLQRSETLPPLDVWFAGEPVRYYYGGHMLAALLAEMTSTEARFAYNLALAGFYAAFVTATYGLAGSLGEEIGASRTTAAALGAFFVGVASNLRTPLRLLGGVLPDPFVNWAAGVGGIRGFEAGTFDPAGEFTYWGASRVIDGTINEFPLFAVLNGDLHAHQMSPPFLLLAAALGYSYYRTPERERGQRWLALGAIVPVAALVAVVNTWSFPTVLGVTWLAVAFAPADPLTLFGRPSTRPDSPLGRELRWDGGALAVVGLLGALAVGLSLPFWLGAAGGKAVALVEHGSPLAGLLVVHGVFLAIFVPYLLARARRAVDREALGSFASGGLFLASLAWFLAFPALAVVGPLIVGAWALLRHRSADRPAAATADPGFVGVLVLGAAALIVIVELVYVQEEAGPGRMNTVFKTYAQVWALWAPAAGAALARLVAGRSRAGASTDRAGLGGTVVGVGAVLLVASASCYGGLAMVDHFTARGAYDSDAQELYPRTDDPTLDALAFVDRYHADEAAAIRWLDAREGRPVVASAPGWRTYRWTNAEVTLTGLQAVAGWSHEIGYRGRAAYEARAADADLIFEGSPERTATNLRTYGVDYIYVGPRERERYGDVSFEGVRGVDPVGRFDAVVIYEVDRSELAATDSTADTTASARAVVRRANEGDATAAGRAPAEPGAVSSR
jgi:YYY domain-containing protein